MWQVSVQVHVIWAAQCSCGVYRLLDVVLNDVLSCSHVYIVDIVISSTNWELHCSHLFIVLQKLQDACLTLKPSKCVWGMASCTYLGFVDSGGCRCPEYCKVEVIRSFPQLTIKSHIRSFLELTGYYRDFVPDYASHSFHLTEAMKKSTPDRVNWTDDMNIEYCYLRECLCFSPCLCIPLPSGLFC